MKFIFALFTGAIAAGTAAHAQSSDTKAILDAIGGLNNRLNTMQGEIDALKKGAPPPAREDQTSDEAAPSSAPAETKAETDGVPPGMRAAPGWIMNVLPVDEKNREPDALFRFRLPKLPATFKAHLATRKVDDYVKYRAEGLLNVEHPGRYVFSFEAAATQERAYCAGYLKIGKSTVIDWGTEFESRRDALKMERGQSATASGAITLEQGNYDISFLVACWDTGGFNHGSKERWRDIKFDLQVRGPNDDLLRPFAAKELFHWVKAPEQQGNGTATPGATGSVEKSVSVPAKGSSRTLKSVVNVRVSPSASAELAVKLTPGFTVHIADHAGGGEWVAVSDGAQPLGFIKTSVLVANSE